MISMFLLQATLNIVDYAQWGIAGAIVFLVVMFLFFLLRALPSWKEVKLAEIAVRDQEAVSRAAQATSFGQLSGALGSISEVLNNVAIEQRHATEKVQILQRVNADSTERSEEKVDILLVSVTSLREEIQEFKTFVKTTANRIDSLEKKVGQKQYDSRRKTTPTN